MKNREKLDDRAATEELVNGLAAALAEDDKEEVNRLMYDAQEKIENLPDGMIGLSEMHDYGYLKDDVLPLTKEGAREALQMLIGGFVIFMIPQVVGSVVVLLELAAVMLRQVWYI